MQQISFGKFLETVLPGLREAARESQFTEKDWQRAMRQTSMGLADNILKAALNSEGDEWPHLTSVNSPEDGVSSFITMESRNALFTITVTTARKAEPTDPEPALGQDDRCVFCGKVHENATTRAMADAKYLQTGEGVQSAPHDGDEAVKPVAPWPSWGESKSDS